MSVVSYHDLKGKTVFISGGCSGIGAAMVRGFIDQGAKVGFISNDQATGLALCEQVKAQTGQQVLFAFCDVKNIEQLQACIIDVAKQLGEIDILVNNAANDARHTLDSMTPSQWDESLNTNLRPFFFAAQQVAAAMKVKKSGSIISLSSNSAMLGLEGYPAYVSAKAAIIGMTKALATELGHDGIRVNTLVPGWVMTDKQKQLWVTPQALQQCLDSQCIHQTIEESDIVNGALFLASNASRMISGQSLVIDGGRV
jgi:NAD(P)-dependent dehydrogenase (short-subunit alcohol dehydrogenase family)